MFDRIKAAYRTLRGKSLDASYDAAKTTPENIKHWRNATDKPAVMENTPFVRQRLRMRGRYEADNNCYCSGMVSTISCDTIGYVPPKLQVQTEDTGFNSYIEDEWHRWATDSYVNLPAKLRILDEGKRIEGENFLALTSDAEVGMRTGVMLGIVNLGSSRIADPTWNVGIAENGRYNDDGVIVNINTGRPVAFKVVPPSDEISYGGAALGIESVAVSPRYLLQWFTPRRAGQFRGICEYTPALPLFAQLRRYDLATLTAAETAAMLAGIMKTNLPVSEPTAVADWTKTELERGTLLTLPEGWDATQFKAEQPLAVYKMYVDCVLRQIGRVLDMPFGVIAGDSSSYNYASARLDYTGYDERLKFDRQQLAIRILCPLFLEWLAEFSKLDSRALRMVKNGYISHSWQFTKRPSIDPRKDADTSTIRIKNGTSNLAIECAKDGNNWEEVLQQRAIEQTRMRELGITEPQDSTPLPENDNNI